jgi:Ca2+-binding EF-hand superfamily protein
MSLPRLAAALAAGLFLLPAAAAAQDGALLFQYLDTDGDGRISEAERRAAQAAQFARADRNGDGRLDAAEIAAMRDRLARFTAAADAGIAEMAERRDRDRDGALSLEEYTATGPLWALADTDGDGAISRAEFDRVRALLAR